MAVDADNECEPDYRDLDSSDGCGHAYMSTYIWGLRWCMCTCMLVDTDNDGVPDYRDLDSSDVYVHAYMSTYILELTYIRR